MHLMLYSCRSCSFVFLDLYNSATVEPCIMNLLCLDSAECTFLQNIHIHPLSHYKDHLLTCMQTPHLSHSHAPKIIQFHGVGSAPSVFEEKKPYCIKKLEDTKSFLNIPTIPISDTRCERPHLLFHGAL